MFRKSSWRRAAGVAAVMMIAGAAASAQAQTKEDAWRFRAALYGYFPSLGGDTQFPSGAGGPTIDVSASDLVQDLKFAFMGTFEARKGQWGVLVDWVNSDVGDTKTQTRDFSIGGRPIPAGVAADLSLDVETNIVTLAGTYALIEDPGHSMDLVYGARLLDMEQTLNYGITGNVGQLGLPGRAGTVTADLSNWDGIVGLRGRLRFGDELRWYVPYYADIGTGQSQFTWQGIAGIGYSFGWGDLFAVWRYIDYDFKSDKVVQSLSFNGPAIGVAFNF